MDCKEGALRKHTWENTANWEERSPQFAVFLQEVTYEVYDVLCHSYLRNTGGEKSQKILFFFFSGCLSTITAQCIHVCHQRYCSLNRCQSTDPTVPDDFCHPWHWNHEQKKWLHCDISHLLCLASLLMMIANVCRNDIQLSIIEVRQRKSTNHVLLCHHDCKTNSNCVPLMVVFAN